MERGYVMVNTGNGKGKTTAALGLAIRALGAGFSVYIGQFLKYGHYSEISALESFGSRLRVEQFGSENFIGPEIAPDDIARARRGLEKVRQALFSGIYDVVIADEINIAIHMKLIGEDDVLRLIRSKPETVELVLTGRYARQGIIDEADVVTEMREIKHHFRKGVQARVGIEK